MTLTGNDIDTERMNVSRDAVSSAESAMVVCIH